MPHSLLLLLLLLLLSEDDEEDEVAVKGALNEWNHAGRC